MRTRTACVLLFSLLFCVHAFGLRTHDHHGHSSDSESCCKHFCAAASHNQQHNSSADMDSCESSHEHSLFVLCTVAPILTPPSDASMELKSTVSALQTEGFFLFLSSRNTLLEKYCSAALSRPPNESGQMCPAVEQNLPLLI
ncbi:MAG: hypothetical protein KAH38_12735 [Candidatus Hydrogenedentes bacterium]|nr:hypothetical protein [Candidatus Hydrogenedentota bacterium]